MDWVSRNALALSRVKRRFKRFVRRFLGRSTQGPRQRVPKHNWSIGIYLGESPFHFEAPPDVRNPVLSYKDVSDIQASGVADPFMLRVKDTWYMFFEVIDWQTGKGAIGLAISDQGVDWTYQQIVLAESFHLSYPYVFEWMDNYYMIPESHKAGSVRLYKALEFPLQWLCVGTLLSGACYSDSSILHYDNTWWLFTETNADFKFDTLRLYYAHDLMGPWREHPQSPIIEGNPHIARPGGRVFVLGDRIIRYAQDCYPRYGTQVRVFEITELTTTHYQEQEAIEGPLLRPTGYGWNGIGMHHIDPLPLDDGGWLACVDGWRWFNPTTETFVANG